LLFAADYAFFTFVRAAAFCFCEAIAQAEFMGAATVVSRADRFRI
jgi:hypothetical protein